MKNTLMILALMTFSTTVFADTNHHDMAMNSTGMNHSEGMTMEGMMDVGMPATGAKPNKIVYVTLSDDMRIRFKKEVDINSNDVVQFVVMNTGKMEHEFSIGSPAEQIQHREMMQNMSSPHDSGNAVTVKPGKAKQLLWHFHGDKHIEFSCNLPGHAEAGMVKSITL